MKQYLGWIPPFAHKVLEFGCGRGDLGATFKEVQPQCFYVGVEAEKENIDCASVRLDLVLDSHNFSLVEKAATMYAPWDCVIYHGRNIGEEFGLDIALTEKGQVLILRDEDLYGFPWRMARDGQREKLDLVTLFDDPGCMFMRMVIPNSFYKTSPAVNVVEQDLADLLTEGALPQGQPYVLIFQRRLSASFSGASQLMSRLASYGGLIIHEFDDWPEKWGDDYQQVHYMDFAGTHVVQTTTPALGDYFRQYNPYVLVFPNELCNLPPSRQWENSLDEVTVFFGAVNREEDWPEIMPVICEAIVRYGNRLKFQVLADRKFYDALPTRQKVYVGENYNEGHFAPYELYEQALHTSDIALLPLRDTPFNRMKSDLKFIESAGHGAVALASPTVYGNTIEDGRTGFIYHDIHEFCQKFFLLIENRNLRRLIAEAAYDYVRCNRLMCQHYEERLEIYQELLARRSELELQRQQRVARLEVKVYGREKDMFHHQRK